MVAMRWYAEGLLERPTEIVRAQADQLRERGERYRFVKVVLDIGDDGPLLPSGESAADLRFHERRPGMEAHQLMRQYDTESFDIEPIVRAGGFDQCRQLERRIPQPAIFEEQPRRKRHVSKTKFRAESSGIEIEIDHAGENARFLPVVIFVTGRHEDELSPEITQRRLGQTLDECAAVMTHAALVRRQQMDG